MEFFLYYIFYVVTCEPVNPADMATSIAVFLDKIRETKRRKVCSAVCGHDKIYRDEHSGFVVKRTVCGDLRCPTFLERVRRMLHDAKRKVTILFYLDKMVINVICAYVTLQFG
jgi:hypothetical protein